MEHVRNHTRLQFDARTENVGLARMTVMAFMSEMNPTLEQIEDVKVAVSEAVTNAIVHGYQEETKQVILQCNREDEKLQIEIIDEGIGIENIERARQPFFTTKKESNRTGMGFAFMELFMDRLVVESKPGKGTRVLMEKYIKGDNAE